MTLAFCCRQPATGAGDPPLRKAVLDAVAFSEVEVSGVVLPIVFLLLGGLGLNQNPSK